MVCLCYNDWTLQEYELELLKPLIEWYSRVPEENKEILDVLNSRVQELNDLISEKPSE